MSPPQLSLCPWGCRWTLPASFSDIHEPLSSSFPCLGLVEIQTWPEVTDPEKFVYEDVAIATYLLVRGGPWWVEVGQFSLLVHAVPMLAVEGPFLLSWSTEQTEEFFGKCMGGVLGVPSLAAGGRKCCPVTPDLAAIVALAALYPGRVRVPEFCSYEVPRSLRAAGTLNWSRDAHLGLSPRGMAAVVAS